MILDSVGDKGARNGRIKRGAGTEGIVQWKRCMLSIHKVLGLICSTNTSQKDAVMS